MTSAASKPITPDWLEDMTPCSDGHAWGAAFVGPEGKPLKDCIPSMDRADWLLWLLVQAAGINLAQVFAVLGAHMRERIAGDESLILFLEYQHSQDDEEALGRIRREASAVSYAVMLKGRRNLGHEILAVAFLASARLAWLHKHNKKSLEILQGTINNLIAAATGSLNFSSPESQEYHKTWCDILRKEFPIT